MARRYGSRKPQRKRLSYGHAVVFSGYKIVSDPVEAHLAGFKEDKEEKQSDDTTL